MSLNKDNLIALLKSHDGWQVEIENECLSVTSDEGVDAFIFIGNKQVIVEAPLFPASEVNDAVALNDMILRTHNILPLSSIYLKNIDNADYYVAFGALSAESKDEVMIEEVETLFSNVDEFLDLYSAHIKVSEVANELK